MASKEPQPVHALESPFSAAEQARAPSWQLRAMARQGGSLHHELTLGITPMKQGRVARSVRLCGKQHDPCCYSSTIGGAL